MKIDILSLRKVVENINKNPTECIFLLLFHWVVELLSLTNCVIVIMFFTIVEELQMIKASKMYD